MMLALYTKHPEIMLTDEESAILAAGINRVTELYELPILDEKSRAWMNLVMVGFQVYGTRIVTAVVEKKKTPRPQPQVVPARPHQAPATPFDGYQESTAAGD
jgi:hypothetical protein